MVQKQRVLSPRVLLQTFLFVVLIPLIPLIVSMRWDWLEAWAYAAITIVGFAISRVLAAKRHPDIIAERARFMQHEDAKTWDKRLVPLLGVASTSVLVVAGLDAILDWSPAFSFPTKVLSLALMLVGYAIGSYALIENRFFSGMVRIQSDRGHRVVSSGPYRWIRHPGYAGGLLTYLATPFLLDSPWAIIPVVFTFIIIIARTHLEDATLRSELHGYRDYASKVRFRLFPGLW